MIRWARPSDLTLGAAEREDASTALVDGEHEFIQIAKSSDPRTEPSKWRIQASETVSLPNLSAGLA
jgi:hypothetical protein